MANMGVCTFLLLMGRLFLFPAAPVPTTSTLGGVKSLRIAAGINELYFLIYTLV